MSKPRFARSFASKSIDTAGSSALFPALLALFILGAVLTAAPGPAAASGESIDPTEELECLAMTLYHEARGEPDEGKIAVGHVVMNRVADERFPDSVCGVMKQGGAEVLHRCQFSFWCDGVTDTPANEEAWSRVEAIARAIYWGYSQDPTEGALNYHADYVDPQWGSHLVRGPQIGRHIFYHPVDGIRRPQKQADVQPGEQSVQR